MVIYMAEPERAERVGLMSIHPFMGPQLVAVLDRYENSDQWYLFDVNEWDRQHPETVKPAIVDPNRFMRHDACEEDVYTELAMNLTLLHKEILNLNRLLKAQ